MLEKLQQFQRPVIWVDADAAFLKKPSFNLFEDIDFSVRINDYLADDHESKVESGTVYVNYTRSGMDIVKDWAEECVKELSNPKRVLEFWDQIALRNVLLSRNDAKILPLPHGYCKVFDLDDPFISDEDIVIEHRQASRRFKKTIK